MGDLDIKLSDLEEKLLAAAAAAGGKRLTILELSEKCRCKPATIHKKLQEDTFRQLFLETLKGGLVADVPDILSAFVSEAKAGSYKHGELLLDIAGIHKKEVNANIGVKFKQTEGDENPFGDDKEKAKFLRGILTRLNPILGDEEDDE
jgi:hypothetical protein